MNIEAARPSGRIQRPKRKLGMAIAGLVFMSAACSSDEKPKAAETTIEVRSTFSGVSKKCEIFVVYAQNLHDPNGTAARTAPLPDNEYKLAQGYPGVDKKGNPVPIIVDGWVDSGVPAYPTNPPPFNSSAYFHVDRDSREDHQDVYVSFPGVRGMPTYSGMTTPDSNTAAPLDPDCKGVYTP